MRGGSPPGAGVTFDCTAEGLGAWSSRAQEGDALLEAASKEQLAAPGLGKLPAALLPESNSKPRNESSFKKINFMKYEWVESEVSL